MTRRNGLVCALLLLAIVSLQRAVEAHVTIRTPGPVRPSGFATVSLSIPTERPVPTTRVVLDVPDDFLNAGGRISRLEFPAGWTITLEKADMPSDVYEKEAAARKARNAEHAPASVPAAQDPAAEQEARAAEESRRKWIKRVVFEGGSIPADGFAEFRLSIVAPTAAGKYRFAATQVYEDGKEVKWAELVDGAQHPAPTLAVETAETQSAGAGYLWPGATVLALLLSAASFARQWTGRR